MAAAAATQKPHRKTVIITGGGSGIGFETAKQLLETGEYRLAMLGRDRAKLEDAARAVRLGARDLILKPAQPAQLLRSVKFALLSRKMRTEVHEERRALQPDEIAAPAPQAPLQTADLARNDTGLRQFSKAETRRVEA